MTKEQEKAYKAVEGFKNFIKSKESEQNTLYENEEFYRDDIEQNELFLKMLHTVLNLIQTQQEEINKVLEIAFQYGQIDGDHHKLWVIDQIVRSLTGNNYKEWVNHYEYDEKTGEKYTWDKGIAP